MQTETKISVFVPLDIEQSFKSSEETGDGKGWYVQGFASTPDLDLQDDIVEPMGIDISYFKKSGFINYEHKEGARYIIGVPTENCYIDMDRGLFVEAKLYKDSEYAQDMWKLANNIRKSGSTRRLGFSVEGAILSRDSMDKRRVTSLVVSNVALTTHPANPNATWETLVKSWTTGTAIGGTDQEGAGALRREELVGALTTLTYATNMDAEKAEHVWQGISEYLAEKEIGDPQVLTLFLQISRGISKDEAEDFLTKVKEG